MGLSLKEKKMVTREVAKRYQKASKKEKGKILDEFCLLNGYSRCYASYILKNWGRKIYCRRNGQLIIYKIGEIKNIKRNRPRMYGEKVLNALKKIWYICDCICGKRLKPILKEIIPILERYEEIVLDNRARELRVECQIWDKILYRIYVRQLLLFSYRFLYEAISYFKTVCTDKNNRRFYNFSGRNGKIRFDLHATNHYW